MTGSAPTVGDAALVVPAGRTPAGGAHAAEVAGGHSQVREALGRRGIAAAEAPDEGGVVAGAQGQGGEARGRRVLGEGVEERQEVGAERAAVVGGGVGRRRRRCWGGGRSCRGSVAALYPRLGSCEACHEEEEHERWR